MKIQALILLFPLAVLLAETGTITPVIKTTCENKCGNKKIKHEDCGKKNNTDKLIIKLNVRAAWFAVYLFYNLNMYGRQSNLFLSSSTG